MYYSKLISQVCEGVLVHPLTGETYGGTDFLNEGKLVELEAVPLLNGEGEMPENPVQTGISIVLAEDGHSATRVKLWRSKTPEELVAEFASAKAALLARVNEVRAALLENLTVSVEGQTYDADTVTRFNLLGSLFALMNGIPVPADNGPWRTTDNQNIELTVDQFKVLGGLMKTKAEQIYGASWQIKDVTIAAMTTLAEVQSFDVGAAFDAILNPPEPEPEPEP